MKKQYYIQAEGEDIEDARETHQEYYDSIQEALEDAQCNGPTGMNFNVRRLADDKLVKRGTIRCLN